MSVAGKVIAITGGFGVLGLAVAKAAVAAGAKVAAIDRIDTPAGLNLGAEGLLLGGVDIADPKGAERAMGAVVERFGSLDGLVNIAGTFKWETVADGSVATWDFLYQVNVKTALCASRAALPHMLVGGRGHIVNIGALGAVKAGAGMGPYAASKAGVHKLTEALAEELKGRVTVNAVQPSIIDTPANRKDMPDADFSKWVAPSDLAAVILFLCSDASKAVTGALIPVTGLV